MERRMRAIVLAYHQMGCVGIDALLRHGFDVRAVFTHVDDANEAIWFQSVAEYGAQHRLPVFAPENINHPLWIAKIREMQPDVLFSFYYRNMISEELLAIPRVGCFNLHGSLLPKYRGRAPANWAILNGESETGLTLHHMTKRPDAGDIVAQRRVPILREDDARTLNLKLATEAGPLLDECLPRILNGTAPRIAQDESAATYFGRRRPEDGAIDWRQSATRIANLVRAVTRPYPGAFTHAKAAQILVWKAEPLVQSVPEAEPGTVTRTDPLEIACGQGALRVTYAQQQGGVHCTGAQLAADLRLVEGTQVGSPRDDRAARKRKVRVLILGVN